MNDEQKLEALQQMTGLDLSALGTAKKNEAEDAGRESKEVNEEAVVEPVAEATPVVTPELIGQALAVALQPVMERLDALEEEKAAAPPEPEPDLLADLMASYKSHVIGQPDARVDGRTKEAKDAPVERRPDGFGPQAKVGDNGLGNTSINRIYGGELRKELVERPR